ncbi:MAG: nitroreductase family protein [Lachnospiraceae bacterium]|nr:nitroreductase family protein [Lachnospiraceae bacterium]
MENLTETIKGRKSVRTFDGNPLSEQHKSAILRFATEISNPFDIPVEFEILDAESNNLSSPVLSGERNYAVGKVQKKPYADVAFGYSFEQLVLYAATLGIGTVWIGGTMKRELFESAAGLKDGEMMPCISPLGYPATKRSIKESMMRKGVGADSRLSGEKLFFDGAWGQNLLPDAELKEVLELVRWAPSAVNKQPWRIILKDGIFHFYEKKDKGFVNENVGDMQKVDLGIALCHFVLGYEEKGRQAKVSICDPGLEIPSDAQYLASVEIF